MRAVLFHPLGLTLLSASLLLAGAMRFLPWLDRWVSQALWILFWGLLAYTASIVALLWSGAGLEELSSTGQSAEANLSEAAIKKRLRLEAVQHPATLLPLGVAVTSASYLLLIAPSGGSLWAAMVFGLSGVAAAGSFLWRYAFRYAEQYARRVQKVMAALEREQASLAQAEVEGLRERLKAGLADMESAHGQEALRGLEEEFHKLQAVFERRMDTDPLAIVQVPALATETYRRGLSVLAYALDLMSAGLGPNRNRLQAEIAKLDREVKSSRADESQRARMEVLEERLASHKQRLAMLDQLQVHVDQLLNQAHRCEASLHSARIELALLRAGASKTSVDSVIAALKETIRRAKEVQDELTRLGF
ncbi:MAG: hypothetical protein HYU30_05575 [Chloroflexi bacterium]|nr:hypothetical protein [Chloroflexota bacterium]